MKIPLSIGTSPLDPTCKDILNKLLGAGCDKGDTEYTIGPGILNPDDFRYLLRHGVIPGECVPVPFLRKFATPRFGPDVGAVTFILNVDLQP